LTTKGGGANAFLARYTADGSFASATLFGDGANQGQVGRNLAIDATENLWMLGTFDGTITFGNETLSSYGSDFFLTKFDPTLKVLWAKAFGGPHVSSSQANALVTDSCGNALIVTVYQGAIDFGVDPATSNGGWTVYLAAVAP
jgi:hypothetical protein